MSIFKDIARGFKKTFDKMKNKGKKRRQGLSSTSVPKSSTISTMLASSVSVTISTVDYSNTSNVTEFTGTMATVGRARISGDMELLSLTEIMAIVSGVVGLIILSTLVCFVYRTKCRTDVRMRKTGSGERRSGAMSLDLMELYENDPHGRQTTRERLIPAFNSPMYGRAEGQSEVLFSKSNGTKRELSDGTTEDGGYYSVALNDNNEACVSDTSVGHDYTNISSGRNFESFKGKKAENTYVKDGVNNDARYNSKPKKSKHTYENVNKDQSPPLLQTEKCTKVKSDIETKKHLYNNVHAGNDEYTTSNIDKEKMMDDVLENFHEVESIDLSSPPTPCSNGSYVNVSTGDDIIDLDGVKHGYINTDFREQNIPILEQVEEKDNSKRKRGLLKNKQISKEKGNLTEKTPPSNIPIEVEEGTDYLPMNSPTMTDVDYVPMECGENDEELVADDVYIYMETNSPSAEYMNYKAANSNYENV